MEIIWEKTFPAPGFKPATFWPASSSLQPSPSLQVFSLLLLTRHGRALTGSQYSGGPSCSCYSHSFGCQQTNPEPVHPIRVAIHLLDSHAPAMVPCLCCLVVNWPNQMKWANYIPSRTSLPWLKWLQRTFRSGQSPSPATWRARSRPRWVSCHLESRWCALRKRGTISCAVANVGRLDGKRVI